MYSVGIIIGRFQVPSLHAAHKALLNYVYHNVDRTVVLIGVPAIQGTFRNPLDYQTRAAMLHEHFGVDPEVTIAPIHDQESDITWSNNVDTFIRMVFPDADEVKLFHARDGFGDHYHGCFTCVDLSNDIYNYKCSGTDLRESAGSGPLGSEDFRHGVIYASQHVWPHVKGCVDIIMYKEDSQVLLGRKANEEKWRIPGGLVDPTDYTLEAAAIRELHEETGLISEAYPAYVTSRRIKDWRYGGLPNEGLTTALFAVPYSHGAPVAGDDLQEVKWFFLENACKVIRDEHHQLLVTFGEKYFPDII